MGPPDSADGLVVDLADIKSHTSKGCQARGGPGAQGGQGYDLG